MSQVNFYDLTFSQLESHIKGLGKERFRTSQLFKWVYEKRVTRIEDMTDLSKSFRAELPGLFSFELPQPVEDRTSQIDGTRKFLFDMGDGMTVETVAIPDGDRLTLCVSSEVGCNLACQFCFTGKQKLRKRLSTSQIVGQYLGAQDRMPQRISNIVFMGMGEPLDNCEAVFPAIDILKDDRGINLSRKKITVSTSGLVPQIPLITESGARLAVSLNAADDETRDKIMPVNKKWPIRELLEACARHAEEAKDKVTVEYVLLRGVTDSLEHARKLHKLTQKIPCKINIIPFNEHPGSGFLRPSESQVDRFQKELMRLGSHVLRRKTMGRDIFAACGQLNSTFENHPQTMTV